VATEWREMAICHSDTGLGCSEAPAARVETASTSMFLLALVSDKTPSPGVSRFVVPPVVTKTLRFEQPGTGTFSVLLARGLFSVPQNPLSMEGTTGVRRAGKTPASQPYHQLEHLGSKKAGW